MKTLVDAKFFAFKMSLKRLNDIARNISNISEPYNKKDFETARDEALRVSTSEHLHSMKGRKPDYLIASMALQELMNDFEKEDKEMIFQLSNLRKAQVKMEVN